MSVHLFLAVLDRDNTPILQVPLVPVGEDDTVMIDLTLATAVELLDAKVASSPSVYLRQVTKLSNEWVISAYVTLGHTKFVLFHPSRVDDATVKIFFGDVHASFIKYYMSPFSEGPNIDCNGGFSKAIIEASRKLYRYN